MKKSILSILSVFVIGLILSSFAQETTNDDTGKEIKLKAKLRSAKRTLLTTPEIEAYINGGVITIHFNEATTREITISVTCNEEDLYKETMQESSLIVLPIVIDINEDDTYQLEIVTDEWIVTGEL